MGTIDMERLKRKDEPTMREWRKFNADYDRLVSDGRVDEATELVDEWERRWGSGGPITRPVPTPTASWRDLLEDDEDDGKPTYTVPVMGADWPRTHGDGLVWEDGSFRCTRCTAESSDRSIMDEEGCCPVGTPTPAMPAKSRPRVSVTTADGHELVRMDGKGSAAVVDMESGGIISEVRKGHVWMGVVSPGSVKVVFQPADGSPERTTFGVVATATRFGVALYLDGIHVGYALEFTGVVSPGSTIQCDWTDWELVRR